MGGVIGCDCPVALGCIERSLSDSIRQGDIGHEEPAEVDDPQRQQQKHGQDEAEFHQGLTVCVTADTRNPLGTPKRAGMALPRSHV
jgi:hypothetical protein